MSLMRYRIVLVCLLIGLTAGLARAQSEQPVEPAKDTQPSANAASDELQQDAEAMMNASDEAAGDKSDADAPPERSMAREIIVRIHQAEEIGYVLLGLSVIGLGFAIERLVHLRRGSICPHGLANRVLDHMAAGDYDQATAACRKQSSTIGRVLQSVIRHRDFTFADLSAIAGDISTRELRQHLQRAYPMAIVATLAPLLGLLGTVIGMIKSFESVALAGSMGDPSIMAGSISFALVTTAMGLIIAAPNLALYHVFRVRTNNLACLLDEQVSEVLSEWQMQRHQEMNAAASKDKD